MILADFACKMIKPLTLHVWNRFINVPWYSRNPMTSGIPDFYADMKSLRGLLIGQPTVSPDVNILFQIQTHQEKQCATVHQNCETVMTPNVNLPYLKNRCSRKSKFHHRCCWVKCNYWHKVWCNSKRVRWNISPKYWFGTEWPGI